MMRILWEAYLATWLHHPINLNTHVSYLILCEWNKLYDIIIKFLSKIFQIKTLLNNKKQKSNKFQIKLKIFIRKKHPDEALKIPSNLKTEVTNIETYATDTTPNELPSSNNQPE